MWKRLSTVLVLPLCWVHGQESAITREGRYWVKSIRGAGAIAQSRVQVRTHGDVTVHGNAPRGYSYVLRLRVRAANERDARQRLAAMGVSAVPRGDVFVLSATPAAEYGSELHLQVPRTVKEVAVATSGGGVEVLDLAGTLRAETGGGGVHCDRIGGNVLVTTAGGGIALGSIDGMVHCVTGGGGISANLIRGEAVFETGGGDIVVQEVSGVVRASTRGGGIKITRAGSAVIASTAGGPIQVERAAGEVTAKSSAGSILVGSAKSVECESAAGRIQLRNISGVRASTALGSISAALLAGQPFSDSFLTTGSGDITVFIPAKLGVTIRAENESADSLRRIICDFPDIPVRMQGTAVVAEGPLNGGGPLLRIKGTGGTIYIRKQ